jgi:septal ring factor EnvC (AmiA/AmiB activator)
VTVEPDTGVLSLEDVYDDPEPGPDRADAAADRPQPRHARPRDGGRRWSAAQLVAAALAVALVVAIGIAGHLSRQLDEVRAEQIATSAERADLAAALERSVTHVTELESELSTVTAQAGDAARGMSELQDELATAQAAATAAEEQVESVTGTLAAFRGRAEALASSVLGSVDPVEACRQAADHVADEGVRARRGVLVQLADEAAEACAVAASAVQESMPRASAVLEGP